MSNVKTNVNNKEVNVNTTSINEDEILIRRISSCGGYKTKIKGLKETAQRSGVSIEDLKKALKSGECLHGFIFKQL